MADYVPVIAVADFPEEDKHTCQIKGWHVLVCRDEGQFYAVNDRCTHAASFLSTGRMRRGALMCPLHGARFEIASGKCLGGAYDPLRKFDIRISDGMIEVSVPDEAPGMMDLPMMQIG
ncbi:MAG: Rieske 2Fe-2S domain-containing protein [Alphaproteobacteria bacterium]|nr:Rieske 2Fe-2S domain-containing protein [Alphaproteobacteria bacterium]MDE2041718.1 Rieske 2Fe-2S domain-containing protein [Alphaproteobacteria bacterium]MDE2340119.1 Rieske 2Fe-2S domain-containing protein [Alphaproteobacteria bacterium]